jgi:hypothetical protein
MPPSTPPPTFRERGAPVEVLRPGGMQWRNTMSEGMKCHPTRCSSTGSHSQSSPLCFKMPRARNVGSRGENIVLWKFASRSRQRYSGTTQQASALGTPELLLLMLRNIFPLRSPLPSEAGTDATVSPAAAAQTAASELPPLRLVLRF